MGRDIATGGDGHLLELLERLTGEIRRGAHLDIERLAREHPEHAGELRELCPTLMVAEELARGSRRGDGGTRSESPRAPGEPAAASPPESFGDFEILREIGRGGMGAVYEARQISLDRRVALKVLVRGDLATASDVARLRAEAESAAGLDHPHIVPVFEVGTQEERPYFTMRFIEGITLGQRLAAGPLPPRDAVSLLLPVCRAVHYAHERGVLHRDLKPSNILIDGDGLPYVSDFGLAKRVDSDSDLTRSGAVLGTPGYMSPEQAAGSRGQIEPVSDVYSIGAILYHMLTGRPPFQASTPVDTILSVLEQDPLPPRVLNPAIDRDLEMIVLKCLQKPKELRYPTAEALARDLAAYLEGDSISVRNISVPLLMSRMFRETHHASILENWGLLWMGHSVVVALLCGLTNLLHWLTGRHGWSPDSARLAYLVLWSVGFGTWAAIFWSLRHRGGPITFVERQIAHVWAGSVIATSALFFVELFLGLDALTLSPVLALIAGMVFLAKAGILSGKFYVQAVVLFLTAALMIRFPDVGVSIFGGVSAVCFFIPGLRYYRQRRRSVVESAPKDPEPPAPDRRTPGS